MIKKIERPVSLRRYVEDSLREAIVEGQLKPGERLYEHELCSMLDVSRPLVREAIRKLEAEKLITVVPHRGPVVSELTQEDALQLYAVRKIIESYAIHQFTIHAKKTNLAKLEKAIKELHAAANKPNERYALLRAKNSFYDVILNGCENDVVKDIFKNLLSRVSLLRSISFSQSGRLGNSLEEIDEIFSHIQKKDAKAAEAASFAHVINAEKAALEVIKQIELENSSKTEVPKLNKGAINE